MLYYVVVWWKKKKKLISPVCWLSCLTGLLDWTFSHLFLSVSLYLPYSSVSYMLYYSCTLLQLSSWMVVFLWSVCPMANNVQCPKLVFLLYQLKFPFLCSLPTRLWMLYYIAMVFSWERKHTEYQLTLFFSMCYKNTCSQLLKKSEKRNLASK